MTNSLEKRIINDPIIKKKISDLGVKEDEQNIINFIKSKSLEPGFSDKKAFIENFVSKIESEVDRANLFLSLFYIFCLTNDTGEPDDEFILKFIKELKETESFGKYSNKIFQLTNSFKPSNENEEEQLQLLKQKLLKYGISQSGGRMRNKNKSRKGKRKGKTVRKIKRKLRGGKKTRKNMKGGMPIVLLLGLGAAMIAAAGAAITEPPSFVTKGKAVAEIADKAVGLYLGEPGDGYKGLQDLDNVIQTGLQSGVFNRPEDFHLGRNVHRAALAQRVGKTVGIKVFSDETIADTLENSPDPLNMHAKLGKQFLAKGLRNQARRAEALKTPQEMGKFNVMHTSEFLPYDAVREAF
jgi:hypothetical protein